MDTGTCARGETKRNANLHKTERGRTENVKTLVGDHASAAEMMGVRVQEGIS